MFDDKEKCLMRDSKKSKEQLIQELAELRQRLKTLEVGETQARLISVLETTPDLVAIGDPQGRIFYLNKAGRKMLGIDEDEDISNLGMLDFHPEWARTVVLNEAFPTAIRDGFWSGETAYLNRGEQEIPVSQVFLAHKANGGTVEFISTIARDISERKRFEAQL
ncbi:MAG: PAS domain S-box protein, partial [Nitrospira sp.]|nr:PAS domain S-box protein [Nitrospira sp.]